MISFGGVVVDHVEDDLEALAVEHLDHVLALLYGIQGGCISAIGGEVARSRVAPVVDQTPPLKPRLGDGGMDREQFDGRHAQRPQVLENGFGHEAGVAAAQFCGDRWVPHREPADVGLVDHGLGHRDTWGTVSLPIETGFRHNRTRHEFDVVTLIRSILASGAMDDEGGVGDQIAFDRPGIRIEKKLRRVGEDSRGRVPPAVDPEAVLLAGAHPAHRTVMNRSGSARQCQSPLTGLIDEANLHGIGVRCMYREVDPSVHHRGTGQQTITRTNGRDQTTLRVCSARESTGSCPPPGSRRRARQPKPRSPLDRKHSRRQTRP